MSETIRAVFEVLVHPDGRYELATHAPIGWAKDTLVDGAIIHTVEVELPVPPAKPNFIGRVKEGLGL